MRVGRSVEWQPVRFPTSVFIALTALLFASGGALGQSGEPAEVRLRAAPPRVDQTLVEAGLTAEQVLHLLIPDLEEQRATSARYVAEGDSFLEYGAAIAEAVITNLDLGGERYLLAVADIQAGHCNGCASVVLGVIDLQSRRLVATYGEEGHWWSTWEWKDTLPRDPILDDDGAPRLELFRVLPGDRRPALRVVHQEASCETCGYGSVGERWLWPVQKLDGSFDLVTLWHGVLHYSSGFWAYSSGNSITATMRPLWPERAWERSVEAEFLGVRFCRTDRLEVSEDHVPLRLVSSSPTVRLPGDEEQRFPFGLPQRELPWRRVEAGARDPRLGRSAVAADRMARCTLLPRDWRGFDLQVASESWRQATVPLWWQENSFEFYPDAIAVGTSAEGDRCFVVLNLIDEVPPVLVSFGLWASDGDWWEGVLSPDAASWKDGFVLDLPR